MGTRHLIMVVLDGRYRVAQYGQWDGYPDGQGQDIVDFLLSHDVLVFKKQVRKCCQLSNKKMTELWKSFGAKEDGCISMEGADKMKKEYPQFSRDTGAGILDIVYENKEKQLLVFFDKAFARNSLFCEYAYVVNLDNNTLEFYKGFNKLPLVEGDRFYEKKQRKLDKYKDDDAGEEYSYHPVRLLHTYSFKELTKDTMSKLTAELNGKEE